MEELRYYEPRKLTRRQLEAIITLGNLAACGAETDFDRAIGTAKQLLADAAIVHGTYAVRVFAADALAGGALKRLFTPRHGRRARKRRFTSLPRTRTYYQT